MDIKVQSSKPTHPVTVVDPFLSQPSSKLTHPVTVVDPFWGQPSSKITHPVTVVDPFLSQPSLGLAMKPMTVVDPFLSQPLAMKPIQKGLTWLLMNVGSVFLHETNFRQWISAMSGLICFFKRFATIQIIPCVLLVY